MSYSRTETFSKKRSLFSLRRYIDHIHKSLSRNPSERTKARLKEGSYKKFVEELQPLYQYARLKYGGRSGIKTQLVKGNASYDANIYQANRIVEIVELTFPIDGKTEHEHAKALNTQGYSVRTMNDETEKALLNLVKTIVLKKAKKDYDGKTLVITINDPFELSLSDEYTLVTITRLAENLSRENHSASKVYIAITPQVLDGRYWEGKLLRVK